MGAKNEDILGIEVGKVVRNLGGGAGNENMTAREVMEILAGKEEGDGLYMPEMGSKVEGTAPKKPNVYSDGSLKNTKGYFWQVGGAGVWWPGRAIETLNEEERRIGQGKEMEDLTDIFNPEAEARGKGVMIWCPFNSRLNSSTRCELGAAILALLSPYNINIGIDNATVVKNGNAIIQPSQETGERGET